MDWASLLLLPFKVVLWPLSASIYILATVLSPVIYIAQYAIAPFVLLLRLVPSLEPLYIFFGCAAFVGVVAGLSLQTTSNLLISIFGLDQPERQVIAVKKRDASTGVKRLDEYSSQESDWQWLERAPEPGSRKRRGQGLLASTILEEESNSE